MKTFQEFINEAKLSPVSLSISDQIDMNVKIKKGNAKNGAISKSTYDAIAKKFGKGNSFTITKFDKMKNNTINIDNKNTSQTIKTFGDMISVKSEDSNGKVKTNFFKIS